MSHNLVPVPNSPGATTVTVPDAGDSRNAASVVTPIQQLWNAVAWIYGVLAGTTAFNVALTGALTATGLGTFAGLLTTTGTDIASARDVTAGRDVAAGRNLTTTGTATVGTNLSVTGLSTLSGGGSITSPMATSGTGRFINRASTGPTTTTASISMNSASCWYFSGSSGNQTITITDAVEGDVIDVFNGSTHNVTLAGSGTSNISSPMSPFLGTSGTPFSVRAMFTGGTWYPLTFGLNH
jgi:hypothetical protein